jgi:hypothetical protein
MSNTYNLVNPYIQGDIKTSVKSKNSINAAKTIYKNLSEHFNNSIPKFYFTIQKGSSGNGKYYHFLVKEVREKDEVKFNVEPYTTHNSDSSIDKFKSKLDTFKTKFNQAGGKAGSRKKGSKKGSKKAPRRKMEDYDFDEDSNSDLASSDDFYVQASVYRPVVTPPLYYWWYDPQLYNLKSVFIPTFYGYLSPFLQLDLSGVNY